MNTINIDALDFENKRLTSLKQAIKASYFIYSILHN